MYFSIYMYGGKKDSVGGAWWSLEMSLCTPTRDPWRALGSAPCCILDTVALRFVCVYDF